MRSLWQDVRYALRQLRKAPGFTLTAVLTLALGIGANVVVFGVLNELVLHPLHLPEANRLFEVQHNGHGFGANSNSYPDYRDLRDRTTTLSGLALYHFIRSGLETKDGTQMVFGIEVSGNYFNLLGARPLLGRLIQPMDDQNPGASPYMVLGYGCWHDRFGSDPHIVGKTVRINKHPYTVLGVTQKSFHGTEKFLWPDLYVPVMNEAQLEGFDWLNNRANQNAFMIGKLKPGVTPQQATDNLNSIALQLAREHPKEDEHLQLRLTQPGLFGDTLAGPVHAFLLGLMLLAGLVLLAACTNLGSLFAARTADRSRELAIRIALGSSRGRIFRQLLTEAVVVSLLGGAAGCLLAVVLLQALSNWHVAFGVPAHVMVRPDAGVYLFSFLLSLATGIFFGLVPARQIWRTTPNYGMKNGPGTHLAVRKWALRDLLLIVQIALCCVLVTSSFVALRGLARALHSAYGFNPDHVTLGEFDLQLAGYTDEQAKDLQRRLLQQVSHLPGVTAAAYSNATPLNVTDQSTTSVYPPGTTIFRSSNAIDAFRYKVSPGYIEASGTRLLAGREFTWHDDAKAPLVVLINQTLAHKFFGDKPAVGRYVSAGDGKNQFEVVGVVEDGKYQSLTEDPMSALFYPILQDTDTTTTLLVRSQLEPQQMAPEILAAVHRMDGQLPIFFLSSWRDQLALVLFPARVATAALGIFGILAMMLAFTGIFGMASYSVSKRLREFGIRIALGAQKKQILHVAMRRTALLLATGSALGLLFGIAASKMLASVVYQATANDPLVLLGVALTMMLVGILSAWGPARRTLHIEPVQLLREE